MREKDMEITVKFRKYAAVCRRQHRLMRAVLLAVLAALCFCTAAFAGNDRKVVDMAGLLDGSEAEKLQEQFTELADQYGCDVAVVTTDSCGGWSPQDYTDNYYEEHGYGCGSGNDGIMLMVSMGERKFHLATFGAAIDIFTDYGLEKIDELITPKLSAGEYYEAFHKFGDLAETFIREAETGRPFDYSHSYKEPMSIGLRLLISLAVGALAAGGVLAVLFWQLRSVRSKGGAREYVRDGSFHVTRARDIFLYRTVTRHERPKENSGGPGGSTTHTTSGGSSAGGHTGSF